MMGTKLSELRDGCFYNALDDEPMFVLLARDLQAPDLVRFWAYQRRNQIAAGQRPSTDMAQVIEAELTADNMEKWRATNDGKWRATDPTLPGIVDKPFNLANYCDRINGNTGHGHVWPRPDGVKMRCGGPAFCGECSKDAHLVAACDARRGG